MLKLLIVEGGKFGQPKIIIIYNLYFPFEGDML